MKINRLHTTQPCPFCIYGVWLFFCLCPFSLNLSVGQTCLFLTVFCALAFFKVANISCNQPDSHVFPYALICSFITITGTLSALIVPPEQSYPQMNASRSGTQNTRLCNIHHGQLEPILWATSGYGGPFFSERAVWLCAREHLFPLTSATHSPVCLYQRCGR